MLLKVSRVLLVLSLIGLTFAVLVQAVLAHGAMQNPISRVYSCYLENPETPDTLACKDAIAMGGTQPLYDWNEVNLRNAGGNHRALIPDGKLCSAGRDKYAAFDQPRLDWPVTVIPSSGNFTFSFTAAVPHNMGHFELYVTRNGYDPLQPLKWSDLEATPFLHVEEPPVVNGAYVFSGVLPEGKSGRHLIYTIWQRHDSAEAFYSCSDVWFGTSPTPQPTAPPICTAPNWSSSIVYQMNDLVNHNGKQWRAKWSNTSTEPSSAGGVSPWEIQGYCQHGGGATVTPTSVIPTATHTNTPIIPTATHTNTPAPPTATPTGSAASCAVSYALNDWGSGFTTNVTISNNGSSAINGWTLAWAFPGNQTITNLWNGAYTQSGQSVSVTNLSYNGNIPANGSVNFGFNANYSGANVKPSNFTVNGLACSSN